MMNTTDIKILVRGTYDIQKLRIQMGNRIVGQFKSKLGQAPGESEETLGADAKKILKDLRRSYEKITDGIKTFPRRRGFEGDQIIDTYTELCLLAMYFETEQNENDHFKRLEHALLDYQIYTDYLQHVRGIGPAMAGVIISEIDIKKAEYPSSIWMYAGLDVAQDGRGRSKKKEHLVDIDYTDADGNAATRKGITFNPFLKTKLVGVLGSSFLKSRSPYREIYDNYKHRLEHSDRHIDKTKGHRHNMAVRYMVKRFLVDLYRKWRTLEGLPVAEEYSVAKLGKTHGKAA